MLGETLAALEALPLAVALRGSTWAYPLVNTAHIVGVALLFGAIVPLDLRLIGLWRSVEAATLSRMLLPVAICGLLLSVTAGALLFITDARDYASSPFFRAKLVVIALGIANALLLRRSGGSLLDVSTHSAGRLRAAALASICLWLTAILLGRLVGYF